MMPARRAQAFLAGRQSADAPAAARGMLAARAQHLAMMQNLSPLGFTPLTNLNTAWQAVGPAQIASSAFGDITGRITGIAIDPADATGNTVYIATTGGGVWESMNAAAAAGSVTFTPLTDTLPVFNGTAAIASLSTGAITVQPGGTRVVLAGTGDPNDALDSYYGSGLLRSADGGQTWSLIQNSLDGVAGNHSFLGEGFAGFAWSTASPNLVVAAVSQAAEGTIVSAEASDASVRGLYYSNDAGATWQMATISDGSQMVQSAQSDFTSYSGNAVTAVVWNPVRQRFYAAVRFHGYYQSADGVSWTRLTNQPGAKLTTANCPVHPNATGSTACPIFRGALAVNPVTGDTFTLTVDASNLDQGIWQDACAVTSGSCASSTVTFATQIVSAPLEVSPTNTAIAQGDYNLTLAAVPTGGGATADTLLFAGATDIFRCALSAGCALRNATNASNGCATPAMVAPAQHAIAALALTQPLLFFGNDGGLWRSTDGVNEQGSACAATDASHFQNLNGGLGSLAEIVHFSQSPSDGNTFLAGVGELGTAATTAAATQSAWPQMSTGEGGYNAIDATNPLNWYINTGAGVSVNLCTKGGGCAASDFAAQPAIGPAQTASDVALIDAPFLLDPALQSNLITGTCRVWRGPGSDGGLWSTSNLLSAMLDGIAEPECTTGNGAVRSLAAGGAVNGGTSAQHAGSEVIYAGLAGWDDGGVAKGGHLFRTTAANTATSATAWTDLWSSPVTNDPANNLTAGDAQFNPGLFDISSIAVDAHDATGATVYATVMGFSGNGVSEPHVYRSIDGGAHWANISNNLPNAPANNVLVDPNSADTVYVALDTGVYVTTAVSTCATATVSCWSVYGTGLPNAPVTQLAAATSVAGGATGLLRAGTYGRGIWQIPLVTATSSGTGSAPATDTLSTTQLTFVAQAVGTTSATQAVTITNSGDVSLLLTSVTTSGDFIAVNNCGAFLVAQTTCAISVAYVPHSTGAAMGTLTITDNNRTQTVTLNGTGLAPAGVSLTPFTLGFGNVGLGHASTQTVTLTNNGGSSLNISGTTASGDYAIISNACSSTLAASAACVLTIRFAPTGTGLRSGALTVTDSAASSPQTVPLSGIGVDFSFAADSSTSQTVSGTGGTAGYALLVTPASGITGTLAVTCTGAPVNAVCTLDPATADLAVSSTLIQVNVSTAVSHHAVPGLPGVLGLSLLLVVLLPRRRMAIPLLMLCILLSGCSAGRLIPTDSTASPVVNPTPTGTYTITVTAVDSVSLAQHSVQLTLVVQ
jgi:hypothetical protein